MKSVMKPTTECKGNAVQLSTFLKWGIPSEILAYETETRDGRTIVGKVVCKLCTTYYQEIRQDSSIKGQAKNEVVTYINGTNFVTKHSVFRHINGQVIILSFAWR